MNLPQLRPQRQVLDPKRKCSKCTLCCTSLGVPELKKEDNQPCVHEQGCKCSIYETRPPTCQGFYCAWRLGYFTEDDRPDKIGVLFYFMLGTKFQKQPLLTMRCSDEHFGSRAYALASQESLRQLVFVVTPATRRMIGPDAELVQVQESLTEAMKELNNGSGTARNNQDDLRSGPIG